MRNQETEKLVLKKQDSKSAVVTFTEYFSFLAILNILWGLSSLLIVPVFASTEAVFYCINKKINHDPVEWKRDYVDYIKCNIWSSIKRGWFFPLIFFLIAVDGFIIFQMPAESLLRSIFIGALSIITIVFIFVFLYYYSLMFTTKKSIKGRLVHSFIYSIKYLKYSLGMTILIIAQILLSLYFVPMILFFCITFPAFLTVFTVNKISYKQMQSKRRSLL